MKNAHLASLLQILILFVLPVSIHAQIPPPPSALDGYTFSYSILEVEPNDIASLESVRNELLAVATASGGIVYATWVTTDKPADAPFAGLSKNQMGLMLAWPNDGLEQTEQYDIAMQSKDRVTLVSNRMFEAVYLSAGLEVPRAKGFYVHREERYSMDDVHEALRLSREAWETWEPYWGAQVIGLFRELDGSEETVNLNRIAWYPSYDGWLATRNFSEEMESTKRFQQRNRMIIRGSGIAIATDRL